MNIKLLCKDCKKKYRKFQADYMKKYRAKTKANLALIKPAKSTN